MQYLAPSAKQVKKDQDDQAKKDQEDQAKKEQEDQAAKEPEGPDAKKLKTSLPLGRSNEEVVALNPLVDLPVTRKQKRQYAINKGKDLARALLGLLKGNEATLNAFAKAGKAMLKHLDLYGKVQLADKKWEKSGDMKDFDTLEDIEGEYEKAH